MGNNATTRTELCFTARNEPGALAKCTVSMHEQGINIEAVYAYEKDPNTAAFHFVTSDNTKAKEWFTKNGYDVTENQVVCWNAYNKPGALYEATAAMAEKRINIYYNYGSVGSGNNSSWIVFHTDNNEETKNTLNNF